MGANHSNRALAVLRAVNRSLETATDEQALLDDVCRTVIEVGGYRFTWIGYPVDDAAKSVRFVACAGHHPDYLDTIDISWGDNPIGRGPAGVAIREGKAGSIRFIRDHADFWPWRNSALNYGYHSVIALPLRWQGAPFGCLAILSAEADSFDAAESELLRELTSSLSFGIHALRTARERERVEHELRTERDTQQILRNILNLALENISLDEKMDRTLELLFDIPWLKFERKGSVFLADEGTRVLRLLSKRYLSPILAEKCREVPFGRCLCGKAAAGGELVFHAHMDERHETRFDGIQDHGHYCQPIVSAKGVIGLLNLYVSPGYTPSTIEAPFLRAIADTLAGIIEREQAEMAQRRLVTILEATPDLVTITDIEGRCLYCNEGARTAYSNATCSPADDTSLFCRYQPEVAHRLRFEAFPNAIAAGLWEGEMVLRSLLGNDMPASMMVMSHRDSRGEVAYLSVVARDISHRKQVEDAMRTAALREKNFANSLINGLPGIFYLVDHEGRLMRWNSNFEKTLGYPGDALRTMGLRDVVKAADWPTMERTCKDIIEYGNSSIEVMLRTRDGREIPFYINGTRIESADAGTTVVGMGIDISYRHQLEQELRQRATTDVLTGVFNRLKMEETLELELKKSLRYNSPLAIAMFDIDNFKQVNDKHGHEVGDEVLKRVAAISREQLREVDMLARWGGEEFMVVAGVTTLEEMAAIAERMRAAIACESIAPAGTVSASFGVGQFKPGETQKDLLKRVDDALYAAKKAGRNRVQVSD